MQINWFTVVAQIINFIALVWLLSRFLYRPILNAIAAREKKVLSQLEEAKAKVSLAVKEREELRIRNETFDREKHALFKLVVDEGEQKRQQLLEEARKEADMMRAKLEVSRQETQINANKRMALRLEQEVFEVSRKAIKDIASIDLQDQSVAHFLDRINHLLPDEKDHFINAMKTKNNKILIRTAYDLDAIGRSKIENSIEGMLKAKLEFHYNTRPDLICGIELVTDGYKLGWNLSSYFNSLEKSISQSRNEDIPLAQRQDAH